MIEPIDPILIPHYTGNLGELEKAVASLKTDASGIRATGVNTHSTFQGLAPDYDAPERDQLLATTIPVRDQAGQFARGLETVQSALAAYASEIGPIVKELDRLREQAVAFRDSVKDDEHWQKNQSKIDENARLIRAVAVAQEKFHAAERDAVDKITAVYCGTTFLTVDDGSHKPGMYGYDPKAVAKVTETPWGTVAKREHGALETAWDRTWHMVTNNPAADFAKGFVIDGTWGTARGLMTAFGWDGKDKAADAWKNLGVLAAGSVTFPFSQATRVLPDSWLPKQAREYKKAANAADKGFLAWDEWKKNPHRAAGAVSFNGLTILIPEARAAGLARAGTTTGKVLTTVARIGEAADPVNLAAKGVGKGFTAAKGALESARIGDLHEIALRNAAHLTERIPGTNEKALKLTTADETPTYITQNGTWLRADGTEYPTHGTAPKELSAAERGAAQDHRVLAHSGGRGSEAASSAMSHPGSGSAEASAHGSANHGPAPGDNNAHTQAGHSTGGRGHGSGGDAGTTQAQSSGGGPHSGGTVDGSAPHGSDTPHGGEHPSSGHSESDNGTEHPASGDDTDASLHDSPNATEAQRHEGSSGHGSESGKREWQGGDDIEGPARGKTLLPPNKRHTLSGVKAGRPNVENTLILPEAADKVPNDLAEIAAGRADFDNRSQLYTVNGRSYGVEPNGRTFPARGDGFMPMTRAEYKALQAIIKARGDMGRLEKMFQNGHEFKNEPHAAEKAFDLYRKYYE
ncbi:hypothetical protein [Streptomyces sp. NPDC001404]|uniref:hypothetical protein n=1 Tax=Streptomyces sp. NPDC001404 TaxID=3364571 RepID=UPI0036C8C518